MKPCPHFLKRFAVLAAASLILSAVTLSASAAAAPVKYEEKRSLRRHSPHERELFCIPCSRRHRRHYSFLEL